MAEISANIEIAAKGGDAAAQAVDGVNAAFGRLRETHKDLQTRFAERFEHVGVHIFGDQLLHMLGISGQVRPILSALTLGVNSLAGAFGLATGPVGAIVFGLGALAAVIYKVVEGHEKHAESLEKVLKEQSAAWQQTEALRASLEKYEEKVRVLPAGLAALLEATIKVEDAQRQQVTHTEGEQMSAVGKQIEANKETVRGLQELVANYTSLRGNFLAGSTELANLDATIKMYNGTIEKTNKENEKLQQSFLLIKETVKANVQGASDVKALADAHVALIDKMNKEADAALATANKEIDAQAKRRDHHYKMADEMERRSMHFFGLEQTLAGNMEKVFGGVVQSASEQFGMAFAQMVLHGQNFHDKMVALWENLKEQVVAQITAMMVRWALFQAATGLGFNMAGAAGAGGATPKLFAGGFSGVVDKPTTFVAGESGPEYISITPQGAGGGSSAPAAAAGGGGGLQVGQIVINASFGSGDPRGFARQVAPMIIEEIRGRAQLNFTGPAIR